ncbi:MAG: hypothetical protein MJ120_00105 [Clostridia bacterium]|nr:hypothetical protein [Clostridia bacterium]
MNEEVKLYFKNFGKTMTAIDIIQGLPFAYIPTMINELELIVKVDEGCREKLISAVYCVVDKWGFLE